MITQSDAITGRALETDVVESTIIPIIEETIHVDRQTVVTGGVRIVKNVTERTEVIDEPTYSEEVTVERVPINRYVDGPIATRQEGDTMIVSLLEEVTVVEKRLMLKEELHITRRTVTTSNPQTVTLRTEDVTVERMEPTPKPTRFLSDDTAI